ncbi:Lipoprotein signal peptidase [Corynebacterium gerontici]|uniref:Lipoprotein signal peptidase n=2 Tax=Corynebacterium gerontici TaxID=2079234 RepID=A0A3G6J6V7_9CORY|nr:Lipoprotein signal peptidase [Corynebacterium gerontici]
MIPIIAVVAMADQLVKHLMLNSLSVGEVRYIIGEWFRFRLLFNSGAAFSFGEGATWVFTFIQLAFVLAVLVLASKVRDHWSAVGLALMAGGALGNVIDRLFRAPGFFVGHVVDFISVGNFAVFNLADAAITCGVVVFVIGMFIAERRGANKGETHA